MEVTRSDIEPKFKPFKLKIVINSKKEQDMLRKMLWSNLCVPHPLVQKGILDSNDMKELSDLITKVGVQLI